MAENALIISEVFKAGWAGFKKNMKYFIVTYLAYLVTAIVISALFMAVVFAVIMPSLYSGSEAAKITGGLLAAVVYFVFYVVIIFLVMYYALSITKASIWTAANKALSYGAILKHKAGYYFKFFGICILYCLAIFIPVCVLGAIFAAISVAAYYLAGSMAAIITGAVLGLVLIIAFLFLSIIFWPVQFMAADEDCKLNVVDMFKTSWKSVKAKLGSVILFWIALIAIAIAAYAVFGIIGAVIYFGLASYLNTMTTIIALYAYVIIAGILINIFVGMPILVSVGAAYKKITEGKLTPNN